MSGTEYADRRRACESLARRLGLRSLREATLAQVADEPFGRHVVSENERVLQAADALEAGAVDRLGDLMLESHASLRDDYRVSTPELDALVEALLEAGALGARLTGAGFGGSAVAVCETGTAASVAEAAVSRYREKTGLEATPYVCRAAEGAGPTAQPA